MTIFSVSSCATGAVLGLIPVTSCVVSNKITDMALPILNKLPESITSPATTLFCRTVFIGTGCALAYLSSIPIATVITMQIVFTISIMILRKITGNIREKNTLLINDLEFAESRLDAQNKYIANLEGKLKDLSRENLFNSDDDSLHEEHKI